MMLGKLRVFAGCAMWALDVALATASARPKPPEAAAKFPPETLETLAWQYKDAGLPVPLPDAPLLLLSMYTRSTDDGKDIDEYVLGFRLSAGDGKDNPGTFLVGTDVWDASHDRTMNGPALAVDPDKPLTAVLYQGPAYFAAFPTEVWLTAAIQCQMRGYGGLARQILERAPMRIEHWFVDGRNVPEDRYDPTANRFLFKAMNGGDPRKALAAAAWNHWLNVVVTPGTDRQEALAQMEKLFTQHTELKGKQREDTLASLRLTVQPGTGKPGSAEAFIDALSESSQAGIEQSIPFRGYSDPNVSKLFDIGFPAMPVLIAHMRDRRLRRGVELPTDGSPYLVRVGSIVTELVEAAAGVDLFKPETRPRAGEYDDSEVGTRVVGEGLPGE